jgi:hypothetical protein
MLMLDERLPVTAAMLCLLACSSGDDSGDDALIVPEGVSVTALAGGSGVLEVSALTLLEGSNGPELYAAVRNGGEVPACSAALSVELFDDRDQSLAAGIGGLLSERFYRLTDGSGTIAACIGPSDVSMAAVTDLPSDLVIAEVATVVYRTPYFALEVEPIAGLTVLEVASQAASDGTVYTGTLENELDVPVRAPSVTVYPLTRAGRPLGVAIGSGMAELAPGERWVFETDAVRAAGPDYAAFPAGALSNP